MKDHSMKITLAFCAALLLAPVAVLAHGKTTGILMERMTLMVVLRDAIKTLKGNLRGAKPMMQAWSCAPPEPCVPIGERRCPACFPQAQRHIPKPCTAYV